MDCLDKTEAGRRLMEQNMTKKMENIPKMIVFASPCRKREIVRYFYKAKTDLRLLHFRNAVYGEKQPNFSHTHMHIMPPFQS